MGLAGGGVDLLKPLAIDLFCGMFGWGSAFAGEGYRVVGFDLEDMCGKFGVDRPDGCELVLQDVRTLHGSQFKDATVIVASPPCQAYSYRAMPWKRAKALPPPSNELFDACFRIQREACEAAGGHIPMVVENVCGAQKWVGRAKWHYGSYYLWGDVPALMPFAKLTEKKTDLPPIPLGELYRRTGIPNQCHITGTKNNGGSWFAIGSPGQKVTGQNPDGRRLASVNPADEHTKLGGSWFHGYRKGQGPRNHGSGSVRRKQASALIAKIPFPLAQHIARVYKVPRLGGVESIR